MGHGLDQHRYKAFLSYSHRDSVWATWLHRELEDFRADGHRSKDQRHPLRPVFFDRHDFSAGQTINAQTVEQLDDSAALVVLCSPSAAQSHYVNEEVRLFKERHPDRPIVPAIVAGRADVAVQAFFPPALWHTVRPDGLVTDEQVELLAADLRKSADGRSLGVAKVIASLLDLRTDAVYQRAERLRARRRRIRNAVVGVLTVLLVTATGTGVYAWQLLKTSASFLDGTLELAADVVKRAVSQADTLGVSRTSTQQWLEQGEHLLDMIASGGRDTNQLRHRKARIQIEMARSFASLGNAQNQKARAEAAVTMLRPLVATEPGNDDLSHDLSAALIEVGDAEKEEGQWEVAQTSYLSALHIRHRLYERAPNDPLRRRHLAVSQLKLGHVSALGRRPEQALEAYRTAKASLEWLAARRPADAALARELHVVESMIGNVYLDIGKSDQALQSFRMSQARAMGLAAADPKSSLAKRDLAMLYSRTAEAHLRADEFDRALENHQTALRMRSELAASDERQAEWQRDVGVSLLGIGDGLLGLGRPEEAQASYRKALGVLAGLLASSDVAERQLDVALCHEKLGDASSALTQVVEAIASYSTTVAMLRRLVAGHARNDDYAARLLGMELKLAQALV